MKVFILCFLSGNDLEDIRVCVDLHTALHFLDTHKKTHQVLEYESKDGIADEPVCSYSYENDVLIKHDSL
jgi:hypothetical protein